MSVWLLPWQLPEFPGAASLPDDKPACTRWCKLMAALMTSLGLQGQCLDEFGDGWSSQAVRGQF